MRAYYETETALVEYSGRILELLFFMAWDRTGHPFTITRHDHWEFLAKEANLCIWEGLFRKYRIRALELWLVFMTSWLIFLVAYPAGWRVLYLYFVFSRS